MRSRSTPRQHGPPLLRLLAGIAFAATSACAQAVLPAGTAKLPSYDIVSIKPNKSGSGSMHISTRDSHFTATNISLKTLLVNAYSLKEAQLVSLPAWAESARFDIDAKVLDPDENVLTDLTQEQRGTMLQGMLAARFGLKSHRETAVLPVYELVVAKGGPKFKVSQSEGNSMSSRNTELTATGVRMSFLVFNLSSQLQRMVIDKTGLTGRYDVALKWSADDAAPADNAPPPLFTAIQEQLGLKLVPAKDAVETFVVDHVEMPSEN